MKKRFLFLACMVTLFQLKAQEKSYDSAALVILDRMSDIIGDLSSCSYALDVAIDKIDAGNVTTQNNHNQVSMVGPDKMFVNVRGDRGHKGYFYNGTTLTYYSYDENNFASIDAPPTIIGAIDSVNEAYGIDFPAADFFYPTFADDILNDFDEIDYLGLSVVNGEECFHIRAKGKDQTVQLWIANDATTLPKKFVISYNNDKYLKRYEATFSHWTLNPDIPASAFEFLIPPNASQVHLMPKKAN